VQPCRRCRPVDVVAQQEYPINNRGFVLVRALLSQTADGIFEMKHSVSIQSNTPVRFRDAPKSTADNADTRIAAVLQHEHWSSCAGTICNTGKVN
jgi:hypothetical protein